MKSTFLLIAAILSVALAAKYAIVIQGDRHYSNYSDSSNSCRAYNDVIASGIPRENVIYMANEETLTNEMNPWPGKIFTLSDPEGEGWDHAAGCKDHFDYYGKDIEPDVILAILNQDEETVKKLTGYKNPKVLHTTEEDTILIYYTDHGYEGGVGCGSGVLTTAQIQGVLKDLNKRKAYKQLAFFLEACESGSVFDTLPADLNIYAFTSANATEPAWCEHCPPNDVVNGKHIGVCQSMYYDNEWQRLVETESTTITLGQLFQRTHDHVAKFKHQEVSEWGDLKMRDLPVTTFFGDQPIHVKSFASPPSTEKSGLVEKGDEELHVARWAAIRSDANSNDVELLRLRSVVEKNAKNEIEMMRLASGILGEKEMDRKVREDTFVYKASCAQELFTSLVVECGQSIPFSKSTRNLVHAICSLEEIPEVNWSSVCM